MTKSLFKVMYHYVKWKYSRYKIYAWLTYAWIKILRKTGKPYWEYIREWRNLLNAPDHVQDAWKAEMRAAGLTQFK